MKHISYQYRHAGKLWTLYLEADDFEDADARVRSAYYNGEATQSLGSFNVPAWAAKMMGVSDG